MKSALKVTLFSKELPVRWPDSFAEREDLLRYWQDGGIHAGIPAAAILGRCTRVGIVAQGAAQKAGKAFAAYEGTYRILPFGADVYDYLRSKGVSVEEIRRLAQPLFEELATILSPAEQEVDEQANFTSPPEGSGT